MRERERKRYLDRCGKRRRQGKEIGTCFSALSSLLHLPTIFLFILFLFFLYTPHLNDSISHYFTKYIFQILILVIHFTLQISIIFTFFWGKNYTEDHISLIYNILSHFLPFTHFL